ncbi:LuxR C-terminal-related transcriptional regulator [Serratia fonticola]|uniref:LuxR C-terminal-related transcriptional regulator n=1 Tax=Serratia fonticola TaxID=47917 RepID=UPI003AAABAD1
MNQVRIACVTSNYYLGLALQYVSSSFKREGSYLPEVKLVFFNDYRTFKSSLNDTSHYNGVVIDSCGNFFDLIKLFESLSQQFSDEKVTIHCAFLHDKKYLTTLMNDTPDESIVCIDKDVEINFFRKQFRIFIRRIESAMSCNLPVERCGQFRCYDFYKRKLTTPELSTLNDIIQGVSLVDIALIRNLSVKTITSHKINALKKLGMKSMSDLLIRR